MFSYETEEKMSQNWRRKVKIWSGKIAGNVCRSNTACRAKSVGRSTHNVSIKCNEFSRNGLQRNHTKCKNELVGEQTSIYTVLSTIK